MARDKHVNAPCGCFYVDYVDMRHVGVMLCRRHTVAAMPIWDSPDGDPSTALAAVLATPAEPAQPDTASGGVSEET